MSKAYELASIEALAEVRHEVASPAWPRDPLWVLAHLSADVDTLTKSLLRGYRAPDSADLIAVRGDAIQVAAAALVLAARIGVVAGSTHATVPAACPIEGDAS